MFVHAPLLILTMPEEPGFQPIYPLAELTLPPVIERVPLPELPTMRDAVFVQVQLLIKAEPEEPDKVPIFALVE